jgi:hypothetical protein
MPAEQAQGILTYLKTNPEAAKAAWAQAQAIMQSPGLANAFINMSVRAVTAAAAAAAAGIAAATAAAAAGVIGFSMYTPAPSQVAAAATAAAAMVVVVP